MTQHPVARLIRWLQLACMVLALAVCVAEVNHKTSQETSRLSPMEVSAAVY
jgi:hypothetical protein